MTEHQLTLHHFTFFRLPSQCPARYRLPPRQLSEATTICTFPWLALNTAVWERGMGGRRGRWGRTSKRVQFQTWAGMIKNRDCLHCTSHMGPLLPLPLDFLSLLPISLDEITACPGLLRAPHCFTLLGVAAAHSFAFVYVAQHKYISYVFLKREQVPEVLMLHINLLNSVVW